MEKDVEKVSDLLSKMELNLSKNGGKLHFQSIRLPSFIFPLKRPNGAKLRLKQMKKISLDLYYHAKPLSGAYKSFYQSAFETYRCCQQQGLHLLNLKQNYEEKCHPLKKHAKRWKLQEAQIAQSCIAQINSPQVAKNKHQIKKISGKSSLNPLLPS